MDKRILTFILAGILMFSCMTLVVPWVQAAAQHPIVLPFYTGWEDLHPAHGKTDSVYDWKDFSSPTCGRVNEVAPPSIFGYDFGSYELKAAGRFDSSDSYCYFNLFDTTPQCDWGPPFKIRPYTFIDIWYRHEDLAHCMIDAQLYNSETHQYWTLRDFYRVECIDHLICKTYYVVDQNGVRIHPGYRYNDPVGSWQFASFDLSIVYEHSPNWYVTKIWIGFDNRIDPNHPTGQARTYFDMLYISYGAGNRQITIQHEPGYYYNAWTTGSIIAYTYYPDPTTGLYNLELKICLSAFNDGYIKDEAGNPLYFIRPCRLRVSTTHGGAQFLDLPKPTGLNLTQPDPGLGPVAEFVMDVVAVIVSEGYAEVGYVLSAVELASEFLGLLKTPTGKTYEWPHGVGWYTHDLPYYALPTLMQGEVCLQISGLSSGVPHSIPITFEVDYCYPNYDPSLGWYPVRFMIESFTLNIPWSTTPDDVNLPPETPSTPSGPTSGCTGTTYPYSTSTTDPEGDAVRYEFRWGDGTTETTGWYASGENATASHYWTSLGTYNVRVRAQDYNGYLNGYWSILSPILTVNIRNPYLTVLAEDQYGNSLTTGYVYIDDQYVGRTGSNFTVVAGTRKVLATDFWESGNTGYRYGFKNWTDGSTANPRTMTVVEDTTIKANFKKKWCPGDVNGNGKVDGEDVAKMDLVYSGIITDPMWVRRCDVNGDGKVTGADVAIVDINYGRSYPDP